MPRDPRAYLEVIVEACQAISAATQGRDLPAYLANRLVRSAVEREFIIIGEALVALSRRAPSFSRRSVTLGASLISGTS